MAYVFNDGLDDAVLFDRQETYAGGVDNFRRATLLEPDQIQDAVNIILLENGVIQTRPGTVALGSAVVDTLNKRIQGLRYFDTPSLELLVAVTNTKFYKWSGSAWTLVSGFTVNSDSLFPSMAQGVDLIYVTDGVQNVRSWDGTTFTDLGNATGVGGSPPVGSTILLWHTYRLFASGVSTEDDAVWASDILNGGAGAWNHTTFKTRVGGGDGDPIVALQSLPDNTLAVLKKNSIWIALTSPELAAASDWPMTRLTGGIGCVGKRASVAVGNDVYFLASDGIRSIQRMAAAAGQWEISSPLSKPIQDTIDTINWQYASTSAAWRYREYVLFAVPTGASQTPNTVLAYNARMGIWLGSWTGWTPTCFETTRFSDEFRMVFGDMSGYVNEWQDQDSTDAFEDNGTPIETSISLRASNFNEPVSNKDGFYYEVRFQDTNTQVEIQTILDDATSRTTLADVSQVQNQLPLNLPFNLAVLKPRTIRTSLNGLEPFNEMYLHITTDSASIPAPGKIAVKNSTLAAFLNTIENE